MELNASQSFQARQSPPPAPAPKVAAGPAPAISQAESPAKPVISTPAGDSLEISAAGQAALQSDVERVETPPKPINDEEDDDFLKIGNEEDEDEEEEEKPQVRTDGGNQIQQLDEGELQQVRDLQQRDREVRQHEQAHVAAAGGHTRGGPSYTYQQGPDGRRYAVGGSVPIDTSEEKTPEQTIAKMQTIQRAAMAPAEPSPADRQIAANAAVTASKARMELAEQRVDDKQALSDAAENRIGDDDDRVAGSVEVDSPAAEEDDDASVNTPPPPPRSPEAGDDDAQRKAEANRQAFIGGLVNSLIT